MISSWCWVLFFKNKKCFDLSSFSFYILLHFIKSIFKKSALNRFFFLIISSNWFSFTYSYYDKSVLYSTSLLNNSIVFVIFLLGDFAGMITSSANTFSSSFHIMSLLAISHFGNWQANVINTMLNKNNSRHFCLVSDVDCLWECLHCFSVM